MKKLLIATTALVATAGMASADITITGHAAAGIYSSLDYKAPVVAKFGFVTATVASTAAATYDDYGNLRLLLSNVQYPAIVQLTTKKTNQVVSWMGARMSLSSKLAHQIREIFKSYNQGIVNSEEVRRVLPILDLQQQLSLVPDNQTFLIESLQTREGYHLFFYPFEGRMVHELLSALLAYRIAQRFPISFSMAMNDYGFELFSDVRVDIEELLEEDLFSLDKLEEDILHCVNESELSKRKFREIASIAGLVFQG